MATNPQRLSKNLETLAAKNRVNLLSISEIFGEKGFAALILILMAVPALPLPTGGITHIFELIAMLLALEMIAGRQSLWLPKRWLKRQLPTAGLIKLTELVSGAERFSRPRFRKFMTSRLTGRGIGLIFLVLTLFAFMAPPFSGLDTLPSLGVVLIALAVLLEDAMIALAGIVVGCAGIALVLTLGSLVFKLL